MNKVQIYADGSCSPNPGKGGWGCVLIYGENRKELCGGEGESTNNRMELLACIKALEALKCPCAVEVFTDSQYVQLGMTSWVKNWERNGWKTGKGRDVKNGDLWRELIDLCRMHVVEWKWVKGHNGNPLNTRADQLATKGRDGG